MGEQVAPRTGHAPAADGHATERGGDFRPPLHPARVVLAAASATVAFVVLAGWVVRPWHLAVPLLAGVWTGVACRRTGVAAAAGAAVGLVGSMLSAYTYGLGRMLDLLGRMPPYAVYDIPSFIYSDCVEPVHALLPWSGDPALAIVLSTLVALVSAALAGRLSSRPRGRLFEAVLGWAAAALLVAAFVVTAQTSAQRLLIRIAWEPPAKSYDYDAFAYLKTFYLMGKGQDFYPAMVKAIGQDLRVKDGMPVRDGKTYALWSKPSYFRQPLVFRLWQRIGDEARDVVRLSVVLSALALLALYGGFARGAGAKALLVPMFAYPWLLVHTSWINVFFPDWWAGLAVVFAFAALAGRRPVAAVLFALVATLSRFIVLPLLGAMFVAASVEWLRQRRVGASLVPPAVSVAALVAFAVSWQAHLRRAAAYILPENLAAPWLQGTVARNAGLDFGHRVLAPLHYSMWPFGFHRLPLLVLFALAPLGLLLAFRRDVFGKTVSVLYLAAWLAFLLAVGPSSTYWGQVFTPVLVIGTGALLAVGPEVPAARLRRWWARLVPDTRPARPGCGPSGASTDSSAAA